MEVAGTAGNLSMTSVADRPCDFRTLLRQAFREHGDGLYRFILVRVGGDRNVADDLLQQTCHEAARHARPPTVLNEIQLWMRGIARNLIRRHWRTRRRSAGLVSLEAATIAERLAEDMERRPLPMDVLIREEVRQCLLAAILDLPPKDQELIWEFYFDGRAQTVMAAARGVSEKAIESRLYRSRRRLRETLRRMGKSGAE